MTVFTPEIVSVGSFIIDDIRYEDGTEQLGVVGGGGTHMIYGARLWKRGPSHSKTIGYQLQMGFDFPADVEQQLDRLHLSLEKRRHPHLFTPRAWNIFGPSEQRGFEYQHKNIQTFPSSLPKTWILFAKLLHFICTPERAEKISDEWRALQAQYAHDFAVPQDQLAQTLFLWEPLPTAAIPEQWEATKAVMAKVHMVTPNHDEAAGFLGKTFDHIVQDHEGDHIKALVYLAQTFLASGIGPNGEGCVVIRAGALGCLAANKTGYYYLPPYWRSSDGQRHPKVRDVTGAGNSFCGGFAIGYLEGGRSVAQGAVYGAVSASFTIEQVGLPVLHSDEDDREETWNDGAQPRQRADELFPLLRRVQ